MGTLLRSARVISEVSKSRFNLKFVLPPGLPGQIIKRCPDPRHGRQYGTDIDSNRESNIGSFLLSGTVPTDFSLFPDVFSISEQKLLLSTCLQQLDAQESRLYRRQREKLSSSRPNGNYDISSPDSSVESLFLPDEYYDFQDGHYDGVIYNYREMHLSAWPEETQITRGLNSLIKRLQAFYPSQETQTHLLHLSTQGEILAHVDNIHASGSWILGVSLGAHRILALEHEADPSDNCKIILPSGSVYIQKDNVRFKYEHSILGHGQIDGQIIGGQRLSIMIRDRTKSKST